MEDKYRKGAKRRKKILGRRIKRARRIEKRMRAPGNRIDNGLKEGCIISHLLFNVCKDPIIIEVKMGMGMMCERFLEG